MHYTASRFSQRLTRNVQESTVSLCRQWLKKIYFNNAVWLWMHLLQLGILVLRIVLYSIETNIFWEVKLCDCKKADECNKGFLWSYCTLMRHRNKKFICSHKNQEKKVVQIAEGKPCSSHDAFCNWSRHLFHYACFIRYGSLFSWCST